MQTRPDAKIECGEGMERRLMQLYICLRSYTHCNKTLQFVFSHYTSIARNVYELFGDSESSCSLDIPEYEFANVQGGVAVSLREANHIRQSVLSADNNATSRRERDALYRCATTFPISTNGATASVEQDCCAVCTAKRYLPPVVRYGNRVGRSTGREF